MTESTANSFKLENPITPKIYTSFVIKSINFHTSNLSKFVEHQLQPFAQSIPSYIKDPPDFIKKATDIQEDIKNTILVSMDVKSLYTSISSHEGTEAVKEKLNAQSEKPIAAKVTIKPLFLILTLNNFIFNSINYLHKIVAQ